MKLLQHLTKQFVLLLFTLSCCVAQTGREFWFAVPEVTEEHADRPIHLIVSALEKEAQVSIIQPANLSFKEIRTVVKANTTQTVDLTPYIDQLETRPSNAVLNTGLYIKASQDVEAYYEVDGSDNGYTINNTDIFVLKGNNALGDTFFIPMQTFRDNYPEIDAWASFDIVATENNTHVTIVPTKNVDGHAAGIPFTIVLNKGQTYSARASSTLGSQRPTGSLVTSDKPIAITYKDDSMWQKAASGPYGNWDLAGDQLVSVRDIGTEYIAIKASGILDQDRVFITATQNNTQVQVSGKSITLQAGQTYMDSVKESATFFKASAPVYAFHISAFENEFGGALLPPLLCTGSKDIAFVRSNEEQFALNILLKTGGELHFKVQGDSTWLPVDSFHVVPGTSGQWQYAHLLLDESKVQALKPYRITNSTHDFHLSIMNGGEDTGFRYGYFSGFGSVNIGPEKYFCMGDSAALDAGLGKDNYLWNTGDTTSSIVVKDTGTYWVKVRKDVCYFYDTAKVFNYPPVTKAILANDTGVCAQVPFSIRTLNPFVSYLWNTGSTSSSIQPKQTGLYWVKVSDENRCSKSDSLFFDYYPLPHPHILYNPNKDEFCVDSVLAMSVDSNYTSYLWHDDQKTRSIVTPPTPDYHYHVKVTNDNGCEGTASLVVNCSAYISIPNVFTPNGDRVNDFFRIKNVELSTWRLDIYDRWGKRVFEEEPYRNGWDGGTLPDGVYFYLLKSASGLPDMKGWVQIIR